MRLYINTIVGFGLLLLACGDAAYNPDHDYVPPEERVSPLEDEQAEIAAFWLADSITAPLSLYDTISLDIQLIREQWADSIPAVNMGIRMPWSPSYLGLHVGAGTADSMISGEYDYWDDIPSAERIEAVDYFPQWGYVEIVFDGRFNLELVVDQYRELPGVSYAHLGYYVGDGPTWLPWRYDGRLVYVFHDRWGDCPAGCIHCDFHVFTVRHGYVAHELSAYDPGAEEDIPEPWYSIIEAQYERLR